jgi:hypothetical protein
MARGNRVCRVLLSIMSIGVFAPSLSADPILVERGPALVGGRLVSLDEHAASLEADGLVPLAPIPEHRLHPGDEDEALAPADPAMGQLRVFARQRIGAATSGILLEDPVLDSDSGLRLSLGTRKSLLLVGIILFIAAPAIGIGVYWILQRMAGPHAAGLAAPLSEASAPTPPHERLGA